jgi:hypothetical protein
LLEIATSRRGRSRKIGWKRTIGARADDRGDNGTKGRASERFSRHDAAARAQTGFGSADPPRQSAARVDGESQFQRLPGERAVVKVGRCAFGWALRGLTVASGRAKRAAIDEGPAGRRWRGFCIETKSKGASTHG